MATSCDAYSLASRSISQHGIVTRALTFEPQTTAGKPEERIEPVHGLNDVGQDD